MKRILVTLMLFALLLTSFSGMAGCDYGNDSGYGGDNGDNRNGGTVATPNPATTVTSTITYPASDMVVEATEGSRVSLTVEASYPAVNANPYKWQVKQAGAADWSDLGDYSRSRHYTTNAIKAQNNGDQYRCLVTAYEVENGKKADGTITLTSPVFTIKVVKNTDTKPTPTPRPSPTPAPHEHYWVHGQDTVDVYEQVTKTVYACDACEFTADTVEDMEKHFEENPGKAGHGGYQSNVQIDLKEMPVYGYACNNGDFTTQDKAAMDQHMSYGDCPAHAEAAQNILQCNTCGELCFSEADWQEHMGYLPDHTSNGLVAYACTQCGAIFADAAGWSAHMAANPGGYQSNVQIGTKETPIWGYACNGCDFTTRSLDAMNQHAEANKAVEGHSAYTEKEVTEMVKIGTETVRAGYRQCAICKEIRTNVT